MQPASQCSLHPDWLIVDLSQQVVCHWDLGLFYCFISSGEDGLAGPVPPQQAPSGEFVQRGKARAAPYTIVEDKKVLQYIVENGRYGDTAGRALWHTMAGAAVLPGRSWQSLKERFNKRIVLRLSDYGLSEDEQAWLKARSQGADHQEEVPEGGGHQGASKEGTTKKRVMKERATKGHQGELAPEGHQREAAPEVLEGPSYSCLTCGQSCVRADVLKKHMRSLHGHDGVPCFECGVLSVSVERMEEHMTSKHGANPGVCIYCREGVATVGDLKLHIQTHHAAPSFDCKLCDYRFVFSKESLPLCVENYL